MDITLELFVQAAYTLDEPSVRRFVRGVWDESWEPGRVLNRDEQVQLSLLDWINHLGLLSDAQQYEIIRQLAACPPYTVFFIADGRWVGWSNKLDFHDAKTGETIEEMPSPAVTHICCHIPPLLDRMRKRASRIKAAVSKEAHHEAGDENGLGHPVPLRKWVENRPASPGPGPPPG